MSDPSSQYFPIYSQISQILIDIFLEVTQLYCPSVKWYLIVVEWFVCPRDTRGRVSYGKLVLVEGTDKEQFKNPYVQRIEGTVHPARDRVAGSPH